MDAARRPGRPSVVRGPHWPDGELGDWGGERCLGCRRCLCFARWAERSHSEMEPLVQWAWPLCSACLLTSSLVPSLTNALPALRGPGAGDGGHWTPLLTAGYCYWSSHGSMVRVACLHKHGGTVCVFQPGWGGWEVGQAPTCWSCIAPPYPFPGSAHLAWGLSCLCLPPGMATTLSI